MNLYYCNHIRKDDNHEVEQQTVRKNLENTWVITHVPLGISSLFLSPGSCLSPASLSCCVEPVEQWA